MIMEKDLRQADLQKPEMHTLSENDDRWINCGVIQIIKIREDGNHSCQRWQQFYTKEALFSGEIGSATN